MIAVENSEQLFKLTQDFDMVNGARLALERLPHRLTHEDRENLGRGISLMDSLKVGKPIKPADVEFNAWLQSGQEAMGRFRRRMFVIGDESVLQACKELFLRLEGENLMMQFDLLPPPDYRYALCNVGQRQISGAVRVF